MGRRMEVQASPRRAGHIPPLRCGALVALLALVSACGGNPDIPEPVDPASLAPDDLVFAAAFGGGKAWTPGHMFYWSHHPDFTLYVFGDRRLTYLDYPENPALGHRIWREGTVPEETFAELLELAAPIKIDDAGDYRRCPAADGGSERLFVGLPDLTVVASCFTSFDGCEYESTEANRGREPPARLADLFEALVPLRDLPGEILDTDRILIGVQPTSTPYWGCVPEDAVAWPFDEITFPPDIEEGNQEAIPLEPPLAGQVRTFLRDHLENHGWGDQSTCVIRDGEAYLVFYDDMLPGEEGYPF